MPMKLTYIASLVGTAAACVAILAAPIAFNDAPCRAPLPTIVVAHQRASRKAMTARTRR
jgi:hypothetical protein